MMSTLGGGLFYRSLAVAFLCYYVFISATAHGSTVRTANNCYNETTQVIVNETKEEWCAVFSSFTCFITSSCYCNITREVPKTHITTVCEDGEESAPNKSGIKGRKLGDPEVAAIAVISSLVFSILLSLIVFLIQHRQRRNALKNQQGEVVQVEKGGAGDDPDENASFLPSGGEKRFIHVEPANRAQNVYEEIGSRPNKEKLVLSLGEGKVAASYYHTTPSTREATPGTSGSAVSQPGHIVDNGKQNRLDDSPPTLKSGGETKPSEDAPSSSPSPAHSLTKLNIDSETPATDSTPSLKLHISEEHCESPAADS